MTAVARETQKQSARGAIAAAPAETIDVLIVGAGISGIGAAYHLQQKCPSKSYVILETLETFGGTWTTHTYPGIRSDSDLFTFGYRFKPWMGPPIATAGEILAYMKEVIEENGIDHHIRYGHKILTADWSPTEQLWRVTARRAADGAEITLKANFLWMCQGYYRHAEGYTPDWPGMKSFKGRIIHPQTWPKDLSLKDKTVLVIGSGATAATLVPAISNDCKHVILLQRSPTYFFPGLNRNELADTLRTLKVDPAIIHDIARRKALHDQSELTRLCKADPDLVKRELIAGVKAFLGPDFDVATHFTPKYKPWQQRLAFVPDGDLFQGIKAGKAEIVTDHIERFTEKGILLQSGRELEADIIVTATGFNLSLLGDIQFSKAGAPIDFSKSITYRGMMFTGVPNLLWVFGYFRASWTLRVDLLGDFTTRLLNHMAARGKRVVEVALRPEDTGMDTLPWPDPDDFNPGYLMRGADLLPKRGTKPEWRHTQDYWTEREELPKVDLEGREFVYS